MIRSHIKNCIVPIMLRLMITKSECAAFFFFSSFLYPHHTIRKSKLSNISAHLMSISFCTRSWRHFLVIVWSFAMHGSIQIAHSSLCICVCVIFFSMLFCHCSLPITLTTIFIHIYIFFKFPAIIISLHAYKQPLACQWIVHLSKSECKHNGPVHTSTYQYDNDDDGGSDNTITKHIQMNLKISL